MAKNHLAHIMLVKYWVICSHNDERLEGIVIGAKRSLRGVAWCGNPEKALCASNVSIFVVALIG